MRVRRSFIDCHRLVDVRQVGQKIVSGCALPVQAVQPCGRLAGCARDARRAEHVMERETHETSQPFGAMCEILRNNPMQRRRAACRGKWVGEIPRNNPMQRRRVARR